MKPVLVISLMVVLLMSCTTRRVEPTRDSRRAIDTIYQQKVLAMQPRLDSVCLQLQDSLYVVVVDSIMAVRRKEMEELVK